MRKLKIFLLVLLSFFLIAAATHAAPKVTLEPVAKEKTRIHFIDVGQGDAIYIQLPNHNDILIDGGDKEHGQTVVGYLKQEKVDDIELMVATHPHADHIGGLDDVLNAFKVEGIVDDGEPTDSKAFAQYESALRAEGAKYQKVANKTWTFGGAKLSIFGPANIDTANINNDSMVSLLDYGDTEFLLMGDAGTEEEADILNRFPDIDVLKVGHHGSATSTSQALLNKVKPEVAVISVGANNDYGHPTQSTLQRLKNAGSTVYRTDRQGTIVVETDGKNYWITNVKEVTVNPEQVKPKPTPQPAGEHTVYITNTGKKYHRAGCRYLARSCIPIDLSAAKAQGYGPCSVCGPPQ